MVKKQLILIPLIILLSTVAFITVWFWPKFFTKNAHDNPITIVETNCDTYPYDFLNINIVQEKTCDEDYYGACNLREQVNSIVTDLRIKYNDQLVCPVKGMIWKEGSQIDWKNVFIKVRQDLTQAMAKDNIWDKNLNLDDSTIFNVKKINPGLIPYLENDKYCERNEDCIIKEVSCVVGSYNHYSNHYFVNECDTPLTPLRYPDGFSSEDIRVYEEKSNYFTTEQLNCTNNQCTEKYILNKTGEEF